VVEPTSPTRDFARNALSISLHHPFESKLLAYAASASAAGVAMLSLVQPLPAEIVYTPAHEPITSGHALTLDLNHDGVNDFVFHNTISCPSPEGAAECSGETRQQLYGIGNSGNGFLIGLTRWTPALPVGVNLGPEKRFGSYGTMESCSSGAFGHDTFGPWIAAKSRYLGLSLTINGQTHYGWARFTLTAGGSCQTTALLTGYAYETNPDQPIAAGQTSDEKKINISGHATLGTLALGSAAPVAWRRNHSTS
jgi:hypothetical protein